MFVFPFGWLLFFILTLISRAKGNFLDIDERVKVRTPYQEISKFSLKVITFLDQSPIEERDDVITNLTISLIGFSSIRYDDDLSPGLDFFDSLNFSGDIECQRLVNINFRCRQVTLGDRSFERIERALDEISIFFDSDIEVVFTVDGVDAALSPVTLVQTVEVSPDYNYVGYVITIIVGIGGTVICFGPVFYTLGVVGLEYCGCISARSQPAAQNPNYSYNTYHNRHRANSIPVPPIYNRSNNQSNDDGAEYGLAVVLPSRGTGNSATDDDEYVIDTGPPIDVGSVAQPVNHGTTSEDTHVPMATNY